MREGRAKLEEWEGKGDGGEESKAYSKRAVQPYLCTPGSRMCSPRRKLLKLKYIYGRLILTGGGSTALLRAQIP